MELSLNELNSSEIDQETQRDLEELLVRVAARHRAEVLELPPELLRARVEGLLAAAESATTAADDEALMAALPERKGRAWAALATRHGEKRLLRDALEELGRARVAVPG